MTTATKPLSVQLFEGDWHGTDVPVADLPALLKDAAHRVSGIMRHESPSLFRIPADPRHDVDCVLILAAKAIDALTAERDAIRDKWDRANQLLIKHETEAGDLRRERDVAIAREAVQAETQEAITWLQGIVAAYPNFATPATNALRALDEANQVIGDLTEHEHARAKLGLLDGKQRTPGAYQFCPRCGDQWESDADFTSCVQGISSCPIRQAGAAHE